MLKKKNQLVGLDIGSVTIKASEIVETSKGYRLNNFGMSDIGPGWIEEGQIKAPEVLTECIRDLFKSHGFRERNVALSVGGYSVIVKRVHVPPLPEERIHEAISLEAEQYIPFDIRDVNLDFHILNPGEGTTPAELILVAAKKEIINEYAGVVEAAGLTPCIVDVDVFALQNIFEANYDIQQENIALIDIGAVKSSINVLKNGVSSFMRDVVMGCRQVDGQIMRQLDCTPEDAEKIKTGELVSSLGPDVLESIWNDVIDEWCTEVKRAIEFFYSRYSNERIHRIILSGGGAHILRFHQKLAAETGVTVETIRPFTNILVDTRKLDHTFLEQIAPQAAISMGLALRRTDDK